MSVNFEFIQVQTKFIKLFDGSKQRQLVELVTQIKENAVKDTLIF